MATYKYTLKNPSTNAVYKYNITPDFSTGIKPGDTITIKGQVSGCNIKIASIDFFLKVSSDGSSDFYSSSSTIFYEYIEKTVAKGGTATFTISGVFEGLPNSTLVEEDGTAYAWAKFVEYDSEGSGMDETSPVNAQRYQITKNISSPTIQEISIVDNFHLRDESTPFEAFGGYIQNRSNFNIRIKIKSDANYTLDIYATGGNISGTRRLITKQCSYNNPYANRGTIIIPAQNCYGDVIWEFKIVDVAGNTIIEQKNILFFQYSSPLINLFKATRYSTRLTNFGEEDVADDAGTKIWLDIQGEVSKIENFAKNQYNNWEIDIYCLNSAAEEIFNQQKAVWGVENNIVSIIKNKSIFSQQVFDTSNNYILKLKIRDRIEEVEVTTTIQKSKSYFQVEKFAVAVGMRTTTNADGPKLFEVAEDYESIFYGGIRGVTNYSLEETPTGGFWIEEKDENENTFRRPIYRKVLQLGNVAASGAVSKSIGCKIKDVVSLRGYGTLLSSKGDSVRVLPFATSAGLTASAALAVGDYDTDDPQVVVSVGSSGAINNIVTIIEYTKA